MPDAGGDGPVIDRHPIQPPIASAREAPLSPAWHGKLDTAAAPPS